MRTPIQLKSLLPHVADIGMAAYVAVASVTVAVVVTEVLSPGFAANFLAPQTLILAALASGALSLVAPTPPRALRQRLLFAACGAVAGGFAFWAAWRYFTSVPDARLPLAVAIAGAVLLAFASSEADDEL